MNAGDFRRRLYESYVSTHVSQDGSNSSKRGEGRDRWWRAKVLPLISDLHPASPILELGAGSGGFLDFLKRSGFQNTTGIDLSVEQVAVARARGRPVVHEEALEFLEGSGESFACIICFDLLEHLTRDELLEVIPLIRHRIVPGGRLLIQTVNGAGLFPFQVAFGDLTHMTILAEGSLRQLLRESGMVNIQMLETGPAATNLKGRIRVMLWFAIRSIAKLARYIETGKRQDIWTENLICVSERPREERD